MKQRDVIYARPQTAVSPFEFDETVAAVFPDMLDRSIPGYQLTLPLIGLIAERYAQPQSRLYDLGCSLGGVTWAMRQRVNQPGCRLVAVDSSAAMIGRCRDLLAKDHLSTPVDLLEADIRECPIEDASVVVLNFTLQFIPPPQRTGLLQRIYEGLRPGGVLLLSEKVVFAASEHNERMTTLYYDFKRANGYSELEISQKRTALENVLVPETVAQHQARVRAVGFGSCELWFQALNFVSLLAVKGTTDNGGWRTE